MKIKVLTTFSFNKLAKKMPNIINDYLSGYAKDTAKGTRHNIDRGIGADGKKLEGLQELSLMNNDLLGFLAKNSSDSPIVNFNIPFSKELWEELIKYSAELEQWGKA
jgi:hypothetical protein